MGHDSIFLMMLSSLAGLYLINAVMDHAAREPMPGVTVGELIAAKKTADMDEAAKAAAHAAAQQVTAAATARLKAALVHVGPVLVQNSDGTFEVWLPDATDAGFHAVAPVLASMLVPEPALTS